MMSRDIVVVRNAGEVRVLSMKRPAQRNAMDTALLQELINALEETLTASMAAVVITGEGGVFSAGADVAEQVDKTGAYERMELSQGSTTWCRRLPYRLWLQLLGLASGEVRR